MRISDWSSDVCSSDLSIVWFDAFVANVDRTARNTNLLLWHHKLHLIDHGAALYFHHDWASAGSAAASPFARIAEARKSVVEGKSVSVRVDLGGRRSIKKKTKLCIVAIIQTNDI